MSYSVGARGRDKAELKASIDKQLDDVVVSQPVHAIDIPAAKAISAAFIDAHPATEDKDLVVSVSGSTNSLYGPEPTVISMQCSCNVSYAYGA